jgi:hypothetical protein
MDGKPVNQMLVDGGACVNIMPSVVFDRLVHKEEELLKTNMTLSGFLGEASDAEGIISKELTVSGKTVPTAFFMVNVRGKCNILLGCDWIHAKLGQGFSLVDELKEVNLGEECATRPTYVNASLPSHQKARMCTLLNEFLDCFAWDCTAMPELC